VVKLLSGYEVFKVTIVYNNLDRIGQTFKFWLPFLKCLNDYYEFFIINFVVAFSWAVSLREEGNRL
jgi:hypothetical protein